jgi:hypothetical protein
MTAEILGQLVRPVIVIAVFFFGIIEFFTMKYNVKKSLKVQEKISEQNQEIIKILGEIKDKK